MSVLSLSYEESDVRIRNTSQSLTYNMAEKQLAYISYEEITSLSPYVYRLNQLKMIPLACRESTLSQKTLFYDVHTRRPHSMLHNAERCK